jgi:uroporphyrinogen decarboxylase
MRTMTSRERVRAALSHREPDRVPVDFGGWQSGISHETYGPLKALLGVKSETRMEERVQGLSWVDEPVLEMFGVDTRYVFPSHAGTVSYPLTGEDGFTDSWGIRWRRPASSHYYDIECSPLAGKSPAEVKKHRWPAADAFFDPDGVRAALETLAGSGFALFTCLAGVFEQATYIRGMSEFYMDFIQNPATVESLLDEVLETEMDIYGRFFEIVGEELDLVQYWGDLGSQQGPLISPEHYRRFVKPREAALVEFTKKRIKAKVCLHTCGSAYAFIPDLIGAGYEVLNPVQTTAAEMDPVRLKREFGKDLVFWGAVDTQRLLPFKTPEDVKTGVKRAIEALAPGGGYILAPCHNIQASVPAKNVVALFEAAKQYGRYPIQRSG